MNIKIKNASEIANMRIAGNVLAKTISFLKALVKPGISTLELDKKAYDFIIEHGCQPSFLNYGGFPNTICASVDHILIHGFPTNTPLKEGQLVSIDIGCNYNGYHADSAFTVICGDTKTDLQVKLISAAEEALFNCIKKIKPGNKLREVSAEIERTIKSYNFYTPYEYTGHGIGCQLHEEPYIPNIAEHCPDVTIEEGMVFAIEPMVIHKTRKVKLLKNNFEVASADNSLTAHYEHTILVTKQGGEILTM